MSLTLGQQVTKGKQAKSELVIVAAAFKQIKDAAIVSIIELPLNDHEGRLNAVITAKIIDAVQRAVELSVITGETAELKLSLENERDEP